MWFALFDFEHDKTTFLKKPKLYSIGIKNACFGAKIFWQWFMYGAVQALIVLNVSFLSRHVLRADGQTLGLWVSGSIVYAAVVIIVNQKLLMATHNIDTVGLVLISLSILVYFLSVLVESQILKIDDLFGVFSQMMRDPNTYFVLLFFVILTFLSEKAISFADKAIISGDKRS